MKYEALRTQHGVEIQSGEYLFQADSPRFESGGSLRARLSVSNGALLYRDTINLTSSRSRTAVLKKLAELDLNVDEGILLVLEDACRHDPPAADPVPEPDPATTEYGADVLDAVEHYVGRFVAYPDEHTRVAHTLWCAHTHLPDVWDTTARLAFLSPEPSSGKTRALEVSELLVPRPVQAINVTPAYLFRKVDDAAGTPTVLFDEIDTVFGPRAKDNEELRGMLNAGYRRGATAGRCVVRGENIETVEFPAYCPVALAGLGDLPDTILGRSIVVRMRRRAPNERVEQFRRRLQESTGHALRDRLDAWTRSIRSTVTSPWPKLPDGVEDRDADVWEALIAIADAAGGSWPNRARLAAVTLVMQSRESTPSLGIRLLQDLKIIFGNADAVFTETILNGLHAIDEAPWGAIGKPPKLIDTRGLARRLTQYGVKSRTVRVGAHTAKGYRREDLYDAWQRYAPSLPAESVTSVTPNVTQQGWEEPPGPEIPSYWVDVTDVTDVTDLAENGGRHEETSKFFASARQRPIGPLSNAELVQLNRFSTEPIYSSWQCPICQVWNSPREQECGKCGVDR